MPRKVMDVSRLAELGWTAPTDFDAGMQEAYRWYVENVASKVGSTAQTRQGWTSDIALRRCL